MKTENKLLRRVGVIACAFTLVTSMVFGMFATQDLGVFAASDTVLVMSTDTDTTISIDGTDSQKLVYKQGETIVGTVKVRSENSFGDYLTPSTDFEFTMPSDVTSAMVEIRPGEGYNCGSEYTFNTDTEMFPGDPEKNVTLTLTDGAVNIMNFQFSQNGSSDPQPSQKIVTMDFTINGESFNDILVGDLGGGDEICYVTDDFDMDNLSEFYVTEINVSEGSDLEGFTTNSYTYAPGEYSLSLKDSQGRTIFDPHFTRVSDNITRLTLESHAADIQEADIAEGKTLTDYYIFYITNMIFVREAFRGVTVSIQNAPDHFDFTKWNGVDLATTSESQPGELDIYYGEEIVTIESLIADAQVTEIELVNNGTVPGDAVTYLGDGQVQFHSNFYNYIPLKITLEDGTVGYINLSRMGMFFTDMQAGMKKMYHGASRILADDNFDINSDKNRIGLVFYHDGSKNSNDYDLIVNVIYRDGSTGMLTAEPVGSMPCEKGNVKGSDYLIWTDDGGKIPYKVSVTAIRKDALADPDSFDGAVFGCGSGIEWEYRR